MASEGAFVTEFPAARAAGGLVAGLTKFERADDGLVICDDAAELTSDLPEAAVRTLETLGERGFFEAAPNSAPNSVSVGASASALVKTISYVLMPGSIVICDDFGKNGNCESRQQVWF